MKVLKWFAVGLVLLVFIGVFELARTHNGGPLDDHMSGTAGVGLPPLPAGRTFMVGLAWITSKPGVTLSKITLADPVNVQLLGVYVTTIRETHTTKTNAAPTGANGPVAALPNWPPYVSQSILHPVPGYRTPEGGPGNAANNLQVVLKLRYLGGEGSSTGLNIYYRSGWFHYHLFEPVGFTVANHSTPGYPGS